MRAAWKWAVVVTGLPIIAVAGLVADADFRAAARIRQEEERLARDIAAFRERLPARLPVDSCLPLERLPCFARLFRESLRDGLEEGVDGTILVETVANRDLNSYRGPPFGEPDQHGTVEEQLAALAVLHETLKEAGFAVSMLRDAFEMLADRKLQALVSHLTALELRRLAAGLDRLAAARLRGREVLEAQRLRERAELLRIFRSGEDPNRFIDAVAGWREFFSREILLVKCLDQIDDHYERLLRDAGLRLREWEAAAQKLSSELAQPPPATRSASLTAFYFLQDEANAVCRWTVARVAIAALLFRVEQHREPASLQELVPQYLPAVPVNPCDGTPIFYSHGWVQAGFTQKCPGFGWYLRRD